MKYAILILMVVVSTPVFGGENEVVCFDIQRNRAGNSEQFRYIFSERGIVIRTDLPWGREKVETLVGIFSHEEGKNQAQVAWFKPQKKLEVFKIETLEIDASMTPLTFHVMDNSQEVDKVKISSAKKVKLTEDEYRHVVGFAERLSEILSQGETRGQLNQNHQIQSMLEFYDGMKQGGWEFSKAFANKLGVSVAIANR